MFVLLLLFWLVGYLVGWLVFCHRTAGLHLSWVIGFTSLLMKLLGLSWYISKKKKKLSKSKEEHQANAGDF